MKAVLFAWMLLACGRLFAQDAVSAWFPLKVGNQWHYEREVRTGSSKNPQVVRWQTLERVTGQLTIPEGVVILRTVDVQGKADGGWLSSSYGESDYLIRKSCVYFLDPQVWNRQEQRLQSEYRKGVLSGDVSPELCFPLLVGKSFGTHSQPGWTPARVVGTGPDRFPISSISKGAFDVLVHLLAADETHLWFEKGVGITGEWDSHHGTYYEYRVRLLGFRPVAPGDVKLHSGSLRNKFSSTPIR